FRTANRQDRRYGPSGELLEAEGIQYTYDADGNLTTKRTTTGEQWHYEWNEAGRLAYVLTPKGQQVYFCYDGLGRRLSKRTAQGTWHWVWDANVPLHEWFVPASATEAEAVVTWVFEADSFVPAARLQGKGYQSVVSDRLGTPLELHSQRGELIWAADLDSYGAVCRQQGQAEACPFRYQGQYEDEETGLYYNRFRYYDPQTGQYISQDPIALWGNLNVYSYVSDSTTWVDPLGLSPAKEFDIVNYGTKTSPLENHHGILDVWATHNVTDYKSRASHNPTIALSQNNHAATKSVYRDWLEAKTGKRVGGKVDWTKVSSSEVHQLSEQMFDAAKVPQHARDAYYRKFNEYVANGCKPK
ncbi:MAG: hypothetical protein EOO61_19415, partial [Hymenobacter sp.]